MSEENIDKLVEKLAPPTDDATSPQVGSILNELREQIMTNEHKSVGDTKAKTTHTTQGLGRNKFLFATAAALFFVVAGVAYMASQATDGDTNIAENVSTTQQQITATTLSDGTVTSVEADETGNVLEVDDYFFKSPTGNISCYISGDDEFAAVDCDIEEKNWTPKLVDYPDFCFEDGGDFNSEIGFAVGTSAIPGASFSCPTDVGSLMMQQDFETLSYGNAVRAGGVTCTSSQAGMMCDGTDGSGFTLSRAAYPFDSGKDAEELARFESFLAEFETALEDNDTRFLEDHVDIDEQSRPLDGMGTRTDYGVDGSELANSAYITGIIERRNGRSIIGGEGTVWGSEVSIRDSWGQISWSEAELNPEPGGEENLAAGVMNFERIDGVWKFVNETMAG